MACNIPCLFAVKIRFKGMYFVMVGWLLLLPFDNDDRDDYKGYEGWNEENFQHKFLFNILLITPFLCTISLRHVLFDL